jgi:ribosomal protein L37E
MSELLKCRACGLTTDNQKARFCHTCGLAYRAPTKRASKSTNSLAFSQMAQEIAEELDARKTFLAAAFASEGRALKARFDTLVEDDRRAAIDALLDYRRRAFAYLAAMPESIPPEEKTKL